MYNPFNPKNKLFNKTDIKAILVKHNCSFAVTNVGIFQMAMVHSSYVKREEYTSPTGELTQLVPRPPNCLDLFDDSYERLEHLGDSILGAIVSTYLVERFPTENEGFLTDLKKEIVCNETLGKLSQQIGLDSFYIISRHNEDACSGRANLKKLGDILEAFIGALWTDSRNDFQVISGFVISLIETYIDIPKILMNNRNFKEQLQKLCQSKYRYTPTYMMLSSAANVYTMAALGNGAMQIGVGSAPTKKQAEQLAAANAISRLSS